MGLLRSLAAAAPLLLALGTPERAEACVCVPDPPIHPRDGDNGVPLDTVIVLDVLGADVDEWALHVADTGEVVETAAETFGAPRSRLILLRPIDPLAPWTTYEISPPTHAFWPATTFVTGDRMADPLPETSGLESLALQRLPQSDFRCVDSCTSVRDGHLHQARFTASTPEGTVGQILALRRENEDAPFAHIRLRTGQRDLHPFICGAGLPALDPDARHCAALWSIGPSGDRVGVETEVCTRPVTCRLAFVDRPVADCYEHGVPWRCGSGDPGCATATGRAAPAWLLVAVWMLLRRRRPARPGTAPEGGRLDRRHFLHGALAWLGLGGLACRGVTGCGTVPDPLPPDPNGGGLDPTPACGETPPDIEGPFYRDGAPDTWDLLAGTDLSGVPLEVTGRVLDTGCHPLPDVLIDVWQADDSGRYDNDGRDDPEDGALLLRGRLHTDADGRYRIRTLVPGRYPVGGTYRPAHLHVKLSAAGYRPLTTQLYFPDDPFNETDAFFRPELLMDVAPDGEGGERATFEFVLAPAG